MLRRLLCRVLGHDWRCVWIHRVGYPVTRNTPSEAVWRCARCEVDRVTRLEPP